MRSAADFSVEDGKVRYALGALKGVGEKAMERLSRTRSAWPVQQPRRIRRANRPAAAQSPAA
jgi:DNA polymerase III alpha subunit